MAARQDEPSAELLAKMGLASLHAGELAGAAEAYTRLAEADVAAGEEAADGLVRVARAAGESHDLTALRAAVAALRRLAPGRLPLALARSGTPGLSIEHEVGGAEVADIVLAAAASVRRARGMDSLLVLWGDLSADGGRCDVAALAFESVLRRVAPTASVSRSARGGLARCALDAGRAALGVGALDSAVTAFARAVAIGTPDSVVRMAWVLTGDAQWAAGDSLLAAEAYRKAMAGGEDTNPLVQRAREQLERLVGPVAVP